jgi:hypothetical protein
MRECGLKDIKNSDKPFGGFMFIEKIVKPFGGFMFIEKIVINHLVVSCLLRK